MKVTVDSKKGLKTNLKVFVDKKTIDDKIGARLIELSKTVNLKGFRPGKVPVDILKKQFGKAVYGEILEKVLKETSTKALEEKKIKDDRDERIKQEQIYRERLIKGEEVRIAQLKKVHESREEERKLKEERNLKIGNELVKVQKPKE